MLGAATCLCCRGGTALPSSCRLWYPAPSLPLCPFFASFEDQLCHVFYLLKFSSSSPCWCYFCSLIPSNYPFFPLFHTNQPGAWSRRAKCVQKAKTPSHAKAAARASKTAGYRGCSQGRGGGFSQSPSTVVLPPYPAPPCLALPCSVVPFIFLSCDFSQIPSGAEYSLPCLRFFFGSV